MLYQEELARSRQDTANRLKNRLVVGAYQHDSLVGTVGFNQGETAKTRHKGYIWGLYVSDKHRGLGIGERLITESFQISRSAIKKRRAFAALQMEIDHPQIFAEEFRLAMIAEGVALLRYQSFQRDADGKVVRRTARSSIWLLSPAVVGSCVFIRARRSMSEIRKV